MSEKRGIVFPILNGLKPTVESCTMKVLEEVGELMQLIGKGQGKSGESSNVTNLIWAIKATEESLDTAQSAITLAHTLCKEYGIYMDGMMENHEKKLKEKSYLKDYESEEKELQNEEKCKQCLYSFMTEVELAKLGSDPCDTCNDLCNWKPKAPKAMIDE